MHEYFGHGLFCEYAISGQRIVSLEQALAQTEKEMLNVSELHTHQRFQVDETNPLFKKYQIQREELQQFFSKNIHNYEGFAMWLEYFLSKSTNQVDLFEQKMDKLVHPGYKKLFEQFHDFANKYGHLAIMAQLGFPKFYDKEKILALLKRLYGSNFDNIDFVILYGSQKPDSDIDLFIVSTNPSRNYFNGWLDIYELNREEFYHALRNFDISVTDPLFSGKLIYGDKNNFEQLKQQVLEQP